MNKPKFKITAEYKSGNVQSATFFNLIPMEAAVLVTLSDDMLDVKKVTIENLQEEKKSYD